MMKHLSCNPGDTQLSLCSQSQWYPLKFPWISVHRNHSLPMFIQPLKTTALIQTQGLQQCLCLHLTPTPPSLGEKNHRGHLEVRISHS